MVSLILLITDLLTLGANSGLAPCRSRAIRCSQKTRDHNPPHLGIACLAIMCYCAHDQ